MYNNKLTILAMTLGIAGGASALASSPEPDPEEATRHQAFLQWEEGTWDATIIVMDPATGAETEFRGMQRDVMGGCGKWLITDLEMVPGPSGETPPPYHGHGVLGWDPAQGKLVGVWVDSNMPVLGVAKGSLDTDGSRMELRVEGRHPVTGEPMPRHFITTRLDEDTRKMETQISLPDGSRMTVATIVYQRRS